MAQKVEIFFDYVCPYCYIGQGMVDELKKDHDLEVEWVPFELDEATPEEGSKLTEKFPEMDLKEHYQDLNATIQPYGLKFSGTDLVANTRKAHLASEYAREQGKADEFHREVGRAYFTDGKNIASEQVLKEIAGTVGLDGDEMMAEVESGKYDTRLEEAKAKAAQLEIEVVPTYFFDGTKRIEGIQSLEGLKEALAPKEQ